MLWAYTEAGLQVLDTAPRRFIRLLKSDKVDISGTNNVVSSLLIDSDNRLWASTNEGLHWVDIENFKPESDIQKMYFPANLKDAYITAMYEDREENIWLGTEYSGIWRTDKNLSSFMRYKLPGMEQTRVRDIFEDKSGKIWFGVDYNMGGLFNYDKADDKIMVTEFPGYSLENSYPMPVRKIHALDPGSIWLGTWNKGLYLLDFENDTTIHFSTGKKANAITDNIITDLESDSAGNLWIATWEGGLNRLSKARETGKFQVSHVSKEIPVITDNLHALSLDEQQNLWIAGGNQIFCFNTAKRELTKYSKKHGLHIPRFMSGVKAIDDESGSIFLGNNDGAVFFNPDYIQPETDSLEIYLTELLLNNEPFVSDTVITFKERIELDYHQNFVTFRFASNEYIEPDEVVYQYQLTGVDESWVQSIQRGFANYTQVPPGNYLFKIRARSHSNNWQGSYQIPVTITPPFWKTRWFLGLSLLTIIGLFVLVVRRVSYQRLKEKNRKLEVKEKIQRERERISRDLHDNVGAQMTNLITGLEMAQIRFDKGEKKTVRKALEVLNKEARYTMTELRETIWLMNRETITVNEFVKHLKRYLNKQIAVYHEIEVILESNCEQNWLLKPRYSVHTLRIVQEAFNNTCKHAEANRFTIAIKCKASISRLIIKISDDGKGMDVKKERGSGNGLENMEKRVNYLSGQIEIKSKPGSGTIIVIKFPYSPK